MRHVWFALCAAVLLCGGAQAQAATYWCAPLQAYYPAVPTCPEPWREVESRFGEPRGGVPPAQDSNEASQTRPAVVAQGDQPTVPARSSFIRGDELDEWCKGTTSPLLTATCGDDQLRSLALLRLHAFDTAKSHLTPDQQKVLVADQNGWALSSPQACGLSSEAQPTLPLIPSLKDCLLKAGQARLQYLQNYGQQNAQNGAASPANTAPPAPTPNTSAGPAGTQPPAAAAPANPPPPAAQEAKTPPLQAATSAPAATPPKLAGGDSELAPEPHPSPSLIAISDFTRTGAMLIVVVTVGIWIIGVLLARTRRGSGTQETRR